MNSYHTRDPQLRAWTDRDDITHAFADEFLTEGGGRCDDADGDSFVNDLRAASAGADEIVIHAIGTVQSDQSAQSGCGACFELAAGKCAKGLHGLLELGDAFGLPAGDVGGLEGAGVVFVFGFAIRIGGCGEGSVRGTGERGEIGGQRGEELVEDGLLVHEKKGPPWWVETGVGSR